MRRVAMFDLLLSMWLGTRRANCSLCSAADSARTGTELVTRGLNPARLPTELGRRGRPVLYNLSLAEMGARKSAPFSAQPFR